PAARGRRDRRRGVSPAGRGGRLGRALRCPGRVVPAAPDGRRGTAPSDVTGRQKTVATPFTVDHILCLGSSLHAPSLQVGYGLVTDQLREEGAITMAFRLPEGETVAEGVRLIAREQIDQAIVELSDRSLALDLAVHEVRKRCKKLRGLLRLIRPCLGDSYPRENAHFRDAARVLSPLRDYQSIIDAFDALRAHFGDQIDRRAFGTVKRRLTRRRKQRAERVTDVDERIAQVRCQMEAGRERVAHWSIDATGAEAWRGGFEQTYRRGRNAMALAYEAPSTEHFHEWRKQVKYHWHHTRILQ